MPLPSVQPMTDDELADLCQRVAGAIDVGGPGPTLGLLVQPPA